MTSNLILKNSPGPFSNYILESRSSNKNKKNRNNIMSGKIPNIRLVNSELENVINIKDDNELNLIKDSDCESISTAEPDSHNSTPIKKKKYSMPKIEVDEFKFFSNNVKQKPIVQKEEDSDSDLASESESESEKDFDKGSIKSEPRFKSNIKDTDRKKQELLIKLLALEKKGVTLTKNYSLKSSLDDIQFEYEQQRYSAEVEAGVHFQQKILMAAVTGAEFLNKKFDPINAKLDGWSESVMDNIVDYEEIFKKLHEKYKSRASMPPELQLFVTLVGSGFMFHLTNTLFKSSLPGLGDALKNNPDIMNNIMGAMGKEMNNSNNTQQYQPPQQPPQPRQAQYQQPQQPPQPQQAQYQQPQQAQPHQAQPQQAQYQPPPQTQSNLNNMTGPSVNLSSMLNQYIDTPPNPTIQQAPKMEIEDSDRFSVVSSSNESEIRSVPIISNSNGKKVKGKSIQI